MMPPTRLVAILAMLGIALGCESPAPQAVATPDAQVAVAPTLTASTKLPEQLLSSASSTGDGSLHIFFLDVGQGDACLILSPAGKSILIDTGPPSSGRQVSHRLQQLLGAPL